MDTTRTARCCCGDFSITVQGDPHYVHRCHCDYCQRRTGNVFQVSCWFPEQQIVERRGAFQVYKTYPKLSASYDQADREAPKVAVDYKFCPRCGSTVYWDIPLEPGIFGDATVVTGIAVGCFVDPEFPEPVEDHYVRDKHHWIDLIEGVATFDSMPPPGEVHSGKS